MKLKVAIVITISMMLVLGFAATAMGQQHWWCDNVAVSTQYAEPGDTITISGGAGTSDAITVSLDGAAVGSEVVGPSGDFSISFVVPANATNGDHEIVVSRSGGETVADCTYPLAVAGADQAPAGEAPVVVAPAATPATLPATGFMLVPAGGLLASGLGMLLFRKRRR